MSRSLRALPASVLPLALAGVLACGGSNAGPDAASGGDGGSGSGSCTATTFGSADVLTATDGSAAIWGGPVTTAGSDTTYQLEFYAGIEPSLTAALDLAAGNQASYKTCAACVRVLVSDGSGGVAKQFFQSGGTLTLTADPVATGNMVGTITGLALDEVSVGSDFSTTPVPGGTCLAVGNVTLNHDSVPNAWTCAHAAYNDGATCDCACGAHDPDCDLTNPPVHGCTGTQACVSDVCTDTCDVLGPPPVGCGSGAVCGFDNATRDICYTDPTVVDPAPIGGTCASSTPIFCAVANTIATGLCDNFVANDQTCRKACNKNADCTGTDVCSPLFASPATKGLCVPKPPANDTCQGAIALTIGTPVNGDSTFATSNYDAGLETAACTNVAQAGPDLAYKVNLTANQGITVTVSNVGSAFDPSISILGPGSAAVCDANPVNCLKGADANLAGMGETFQFTAPTAGTYFVIVDSFGAPGGTFTLDVTSP